MLTVERFIGDFLAHVAFDPEYDPQKAREYYLRTRQLKGRSSGSKQTPLADYVVKDVPKKSLIRTRTSSAPNLVGQKRQAAVNSRVASLQKRLSSLETALSDLLSKAKPKGSSDSKQTSQQKQSAAESSKDYASKNKEKIADKAKEAYDKNPYANLSIEEVRAKIANIRAELKTAIGNARTQSSTLKTVKGR